MAVEQRLASLGLVLPNKDYPQLKLIQYDVTPENELEFTMVWQSFDTPYRMWAEEDRITRDDRFFGPGVWAQVEKVNGPERLVGIKLTTGERPASAAVPTATESAEAAVDA